jgi:uncharacterized membrane protein YGL010W
MRSFEQWMSEYSVSHRNPKNQAIHKVCVPLIMFSVIGFLWCLPRPQVFNPSVYFNWGTVFISLCLLFYLSLNVKMALGMFLMASVMGWVCQLLFEQGILLPVSLIVFVLAWIGQFYGHKIEGKKPSFLQDLVFLLIGPLWVLRFITQRK